VTLNSVATTKCLLVLCTQGYTNATVRYFTGGSATIFVCQATCYSAGTATITSGASVVVKVKTPNGIVAGKPTYITVGSLTSNQVTSS
jgi:hypothetical protein